MPAKTVPKRSKQAKTSETPDELHLTHPDRVIDATLGATKREVAEYYADISQWILPQLKHRPVALVRAPDGLAGELFFQKNAGQLHIPNVLSYEKAEAGQAAMVINRPDTLLGAVQMNMLELHTWNATDKDFDKPDRFVLDLDPDPALPWKAMLEATQLTLTLLDELGLKVFLKTSGGKGIHVVVPLTRRAGWDEVKGFSHAIVNYLATLFPDRLSAVSGPKKPCWAHLHRLPAQQQRRHHRVRLLPASPRGAACFGAHMARGAGAAQGRQHVEHRQRARASRSSRRPMGRPGQGASVHHCPHAQATGALVMAQQRMDMTRETRP